MHELWALQQGEAVALAQQLLQADRVIHEQQLGWGWRPPHDSVFASPHDPPAAGAPRDGRGGGAGVASGGAASGAQAAELGGEGGVEEGGHAGSEAQGAEGGEEASGAEAATEEAAVEGSATTGAAAGHSGGTTSNEVRRGSGHPHPPAAAHNSAAALHVFARCSEREQHVQPWALLSSPPCPPPPSRLPPTSASCRRPKPITQPPTTTPQVSQRLSLPRYYGALVLLTDAAGFLVAPRAAQLLASFPSQDESGRVDAASVVRALGVTDGPGFEALMDALTEGGGGSSGGCEEGESGELALVHPDEALRRLREFLEAEAVAAVPMVGAGSGGTAVPSRGGSPVAGDGMGGGGGGGGAAAVGGSGVAKRAAAREALYWARLGGVVSEAQWRMWCGLEKQLTR